MAENETTQPTPEQITDMRNRMDLYYREQIPYMKVQLEFEKLMAEIEEARFTRTKYTMGLAQIMTEQKEMTAAPKGKSKLKKAE